MNVPGLVGLSHNLPGITGLEKPSGLDEILETAHDVGLVKAHAGVVGAVSWPLRTRGRHVISAILVRAPLDSISIALGSFAVRNGWA